MVIGLWGASSDSDGSYGREGYSLTLTGLVSALCVCACMLAHSFSVLSLSNSTYFRVLLNNE
jgi:hypothetical protein